MLPKEWTLACMSVSIRHVNMLLRATLWRRVAELTFQGHPFEDLSEQVMQELVGDVTRTVAAPLAELFAFLGDGHVHCPFVKDSDLALFANPDFWRYGLFRSVPTFARQKSYKLKHFFARVRSSVHRSSFKKGKL